MLADVNTDRLFVNQTWKPPEGVTPGSRETAVVEGAVLSGCTLVRCELAGRAELIANCTLIDCVYLRPRLGLQGCVVVGGRQLMTVEPAAERSLAALPEEARRVLLNHKEVIEWDGFDGREFDGKIDDHSRASWSGSAILLYRRDLSTGEMFLVDVVSESAFRLIGRKA